MVELLLFINRYPIFIRACSAFNSILDIQIMEPC